MALKTVRPTTPSLRHLVLVDPAGIRPVESKLLDIFVIPWQDVVRRCFYNADDCEEFLRKGGMRSRA